MIRFFLSLSSKIALIYILFSQISFHAMAQQKEQWKGQWIGLEKFDTKESNVWAGFKKEFEISTLPKKAVAKIAVDSKYWLYLNDKLVVFEGGLKRGPNRNDTYYDEVDLAPYLKKGKNTLAIKVWYFGKQGFSHHSSGTLGLLFDLKTNYLNVYSDGSWIVKRLNEYTTAPSPEPNFRLSESNILYDARIADQLWYTKSVDKRGFDKVKIYGSYGVAPWNNLHKRSIPLWKDYGMKSFPANAIVRKGDTVRCKLPYNMQFTPYFDIESDAGIKIELFTDNYFIYTGTSERNIRAEYITTKGRQQYESDGWINGHEMYFILPENVKINSLKYRETGYAADFTGQFESNDVFLNKLWKKAARTLYVTMRDTYMDCPDRERAQWTGDAVIQAQESYYALSPSSRALCQKWLHELIDWQKPTGEIYAPVPSGNWDKELPDQTLASIGYYGVWMYYLHTGDKELLSRSYQPIQRYLALWEKESTGLVKMRAGGWQWGDWGDNKDMLLLYNMWYYLAIKGSYLMANELGYNSEANRLKAEMDSFKLSFNKLFWTGKQYRDPAYTGETDDRVHALAVVSDIAAPEKYPAILDVFKKEYHASPYMEKYVYEAMYKMGQPVLANERHKRRFEGMVNNPNFSTLFEGWGVGKEGFGGGTVNHSWSGGGLTVLSSEVSGIKPLRPGFARFAVSPQLGDLSVVKATVPTVRGNIQIDLKQSVGMFNMNLTVPKSTTAVFKLPKPEYRRITLNNKSLGEVLRVRTDVQLKGDVIILPNGKWVVSIAY